HAAFCQLVGLQDAALVGGAAVLEEGAGQLALAQVETDLELDGAGGAVWCAAAVAAPQLGEAVGQGDLGAVLGGHGTEPRQQVEGGRRRRGDGLADGVGEDAAEEVGGFWGEASLEGLGGGGVASTGGGLGEVVEGGQGVGQATEDEGLGEDGAAELALALAKAAVFCRGVGRGEQGGLQ